LEYPYQIDARINRYEIQELFGSYVANSIRNVFLTQSI